MGEREIGNMRWVQNVLGWSKSKYSEERQEAPVVQIRGDKAWAQGLQ